MALRYFSFNKLVRDKTIQRMREKNCTLTYTRIIEKEYLTALFEKAQEELFELKEAQTFKECIAELADILEVVHALAYAHKIDMKTIEQERQNRLIERGGFFDGCFGQVLMVDENNQEVINYCKADQRYKEIKEVKDAS